MRLQGTGFPVAERDRLGIRGLVPPRELDIEAQAQKVYEEFSRRPSNLDKWLALQALQDRKCAPHACCISVVLAVLTRPALQ